MLAIVKEGLMRSLQNNSVHYTQSYRHCHDCQSVCTITKVCVQNVLSVLKCKLEDGRHCLIASSTNTWWKCSHSPVRRDLSWLT